MKSSMLIIKSSMTYLVKKFEKRILKKYNQIIETHLKRSL